LRQWIDDTYFLHPLIYFLYPLIHFLYSLIYFTRSLILFLSASSSCSSASSHSFRDSTITPIAERHLEQSLIGPASEFVLIPFRSEFIILSSPCEVAFALTTTSFLVIQYRKNALRFGSRCYESCSAPSPHYLFKQVGLGERRLLRDLREHRYSCSRGGNTDFQVIPRYNPV
jgi:hypothetical protein